MKAAYKAQGPLLDSKNGNDYKVSASLPAPLYRRFYQFLKEAEMYKAEGVRLAIYKLLNEKSS